MSRPNSSANKRKCQTHTSLREFDSLALGARPRDYRPDQIKMQIEYFDPPAALARNILTLYDLRWEHNLVYDRHPGQAPHLFIVLRGKGCFDFNTHVDPVEPGAYMFSTFETSIPFRVDSAWQCVGISLSPYGWGSLTGESLAKFKNRVFPAQEALGDDITVFAQEVIERCDAGELSGKGASFEVAKWAGKRFGTLPSPHEELIEHVLAWLGSSLSPPLEELYEGQDYSRRQMERLVQYYFGFAPLGLARKFRALRAYNLLSQPDLTDEAEAEIAGGFADQPHMIREIRRFSGRTPTRLKGSMDRMLTQASGIRNLERLGAYRAIGRDKQA